MNMSIRPFDTHEYVQELIRGGFSPQLAEANMHALVKALDFTIEHRLVTQREFQDVILNLDKFATKEELLQLEHRLEIKIQNLDHKIDKIFLKTMVATGTMMTVMMTITCSVLGFLIKF